MVTKITPRADSISIRRLESGASINRMKPVDAELARRADVLIGNKDGVLTDAEMNSYITEHLPIVTEAMARKDLVPEAKSLLARAIALQVKAGEAEENALLARAIDGRATNRAGRRIGNGDQRISRAEITEFIRDREARLKTHPAKANEYEPQLTLARRVLQRIGQRSWASK